MNLPAIDPVTDALLVIDMQPDFMPGGALPVAEGDQLPQRVGAIMPRFSTVVATQDWHPADHLSFASSHEGRKPYNQIEMYGHPQTLWPDHCVQGTPGAVLHGGLPRHAISLILRKGANPAVDSYSAFYENYGPDKKRGATGLMGFLFERRVRRVFVCGLARDFCVKWTAEDASRNGALKTIVLWNLTRAVFPENDTQTEAEMKDAFVQILK